MPREDVNIKVTADVAEAVQLWKSMQEGPQAMANEMQAMGQKGSRATKGITDELVGMVGKWATVAAGIQAAQQMLMQYLQTQREVNELTQSTTLGNDDVMRGLAQQAGMSSEAEIARYRKELHSIAVRNKASFQAVATVAKSLVSGGGDAESVVFGGAAEAQVQNQLATGGFSSLSDPTAANATAMELNAMRQGFNADAVRDIGVANKILFDKSRFETSDMQFLAPKMSGIAAVTGQSSDQIKAAFSVGKDVSDAATMATAYRATINNLVKAANDRKALAALQGAGGSIADLDFGELGSSEVFNRLSGMRAGLSGQRLAEFDQALFKTEGAPFAQQFFTREGLRKYRSRMGAIQSGDESFDSSLAIAGRGTAASERFGKAVEERTFDDETMGVTHESVRRILRSQLYDAREQGRIAKNISIEGPLRNFDWAEWVGRSPEQSLGWALDPSAIPSEVQDDIRSTVNELKLDIRLEDASGRAIPHRVGVEQNSDESAVRFGQGGFAGFQGGR